MIRAILDQNSILDLQQNSDVDEFILTPMFFWELFNVIDLSVEKKLIELLSTIASRIVIVGKGVDCERQEIDLRAQIPFDSLVDHDTTRYFRQKIVGNEFCLSAFRALICTGLTVDSFNNPFKALAEAKWNPLFKNGHDNFLNSQVRKEQRAGFEKIDEKITKGIALTCISICADELVGLGYSTEVAEVFLRTPSIFFNRIFCHAALYCYRSTHTSNSDSSKKSANDCKDIDYLFLTHHATRLLSHDKVISLIFKHLKLAHKIISNWQ